MFINKAQLDHLHCNFTIFQAFQENINYCLKPQHYHVVVFEIWVNSYLSPPFQELEKPKTYKRIQLPLSVVLYVISLLKSHTNGIHY